jgi:hypothetical protein
MKRWIVLGLVVLLLALLVLRERFDTYEEALKDVGQSTGYVTPTCASGFTLSADAFSCEGTVDGKKEVKDPQCPTGTSFVRKDTRGVCEPPSGSIPNGNTTSVPATVETPATEVPTSSVTGTTTGGTSGVQMGPTSGGGGKGKTVWGPAFSGAAEGPVGGSSSDSTKSTPYPTLLGGMMGKSSTRIDGVGVTSPSGAGLGDVMPSDASLGTDANARFFPHSRQPGDMDIVSDPYRLAKNFSTSSYSSKPDPVPFLTDFSAFYK